MYSILAEYTLISHIDKRSLEKELQRASPSNSPVMVEETETMLSISFGKDKVILPIDNRMDYATLIKELKLKGLL
jgi:hypothetical protein